MVISGYNKAPCGREAQGACRRETMTLRTSCNNYTSLTATHEYDYYQGMEMNGWVSNLTKNTASLRINFPENTTDEQIEEFAKRLTGEALVTDGRKDENVRQWVVKPYKRDYAVMGVSSARVRLHKGK